ncbi:MAG: sigma-70 family RNA polymerase sigma factor [Chloroflexota bacterium]
MFEAHEAQILAYAMRRTIQLADAEDAAAEVFTIAWRRVSDIPDDALPWLYGVARRVLANQRRGGLRRLNLVRHVEDDVPTPDHLGTDQDSPGIIALARLQPGDQELLRLVAWEDLDHAEIATVLGITSNAVAIRLHRARQRFAAMLGEVESERGLKGLALSRTFRWRRATHDAAPEGVGDD